MDQRSGVGWFSGWIKNFVIFSWYFNAEFWSTRYEDFFSNEQKSSIIPISRGKSAWRNKKAQKQDSFLRGRQIAHLIYEQFWVSGIQWFFRKLRRPSHYQSTKWWYSGIRFKAVRNFCPWQKSRLMTSWKESTNEEYVLELYDLETYQKEVLTWLSQIENYVEEEYRARNSK